MSDRFSYQLDASNDFIDEIRSYDEAEQIIIELAEQGDNTAWARGDVMLRVLPMEEATGGRPKKEQAEQRKVLAQLAFAARWTPQHANQVRLNCAYYPRKSETRVSLLEHGVPITFARLARQRIPENPRLAVTECVDAVERGLSRREFKNELLRKYPDEEPPASLPTIDPAQVELYHGDCLDILSDFAPSRLVDLVIADPPYNVTDQEWDQFPSRSAYLDFIKGWLITTRKVLAPEYHLFLFCSSDYAADIEILLRGGNWPIKSRLIWHRRNLQMGQDARDQFLRTYDVIFHCGNRPLNWPVRDEIEEWGEARFDVQTHAVPQTNFADRRLHPTQKPLALIRRLIQFGSYDNEVVLDPFAGSGTTAHACAEVGNRMCILIEKETDYIEVIKARLGLSNERL